MNKIQFENILTGLFNALERKNLSPLLIICRQKRIEDSLVSQQNANLLNIKTLFFKMSKAPLQ